MKRIGYLWDKVTSIENIKLAHKMARKDKAFYKEVQMVDANLDECAKEIQSLLINKTYKVSEYRTQVIDDKGKDRKLMKLQYYPDRIIQWAIMLQLEPMFMRTFCKHTCASIPGRGIKRARNLMLSYLKDTQGSKYCLKLDIRKFYDNIDHAMLKQKLRCRLKDNDLLWLLDTIIDSYPGEVGVPIGSYLSQYFANFYLSDFDHFLKEKLQVKKCVRYMDDVVILTEAKGVLHWYLYLITLFLDTQKLVLKTNYQIFNVNIRGVDFIGFRFFHQFILIRKKTVERLKKLSAEIVRKDKLGVPITEKEFCGVNAYVGWLTLCNSYHIWDKYITPTRRAVYKYYWNIVNNNDKKTERAKIVCYNKYIHKFNMKKGAVA